MARDWVETLNQVDCGWEGMVGSRWCLTSGLLNVVVLIVQSDQRLVQTPRLCIPVRVASPRLRLF